MGTLANIGMVLGLGATVLAGSVAGVTVNNNKQLENDNKQLVVEVENAKEENSQLLDTNKLQETMIENLKTEKAILQTQVDTITAEKGELNTQLATEQEKYNTLVAEKTELTNIYNALVESNNLTLEEKAELETQIAEKQNQIDEQLINITALNSTIAEKDATILSLQNQLREVSKQIDEVTFSYRYDTHEINFQFYDGIDGSVLFNYYIGNIYDITSFEDESLSYNFTSGEGLKNVLKFFQFPCTILSFKSISLYDVSTENRNGLLNLYSQPYVISSEISCNFEILLNGEEIDYSSLEDDISYKHNYFVEYQLNENNEVSYLRIVCSLEEII